MNQCTFSTSACTLHTQIQVIQPNTHDIEFVKSRDKNAIKSNWGEEFNWYLFQSNSIWLNFALHVCSEAKWDAYLAIGNSANRMKDQLN